VYDRREKHQIVPRGQGIHRIISGDQVDLLLAPALLKVMSREGYDVGKIEYRGTIVLSLPSVSDPVFWIG